MGSWQELVQAAKTAVTPAPGLRAVTLAQWIIESGRGTSDLSKVHNNYAGLKWRPEMEGFATPVAYQAHDGLADYCAFASPAAFVAGYWRFIGRSVYDGWQIYKEDPPGYICFLKSRGYAGDPHYLGKVLGRVAEAEGLLAGAAPAPVPAAPVVTAVPVPPPPADADDADRPNRSEMGETLDDLLGPDDEPEIVAVAGVDHRFRGARPGGLEGAIVHYDAGRSRPTTGADNPDWGARATLEHGERSGFAYATIARSGKVFVPANMDWGKWGSHAGESLCPVTRRTAVSQYYVGFEINSPGLVYPTENADVFVPWFEAERTANGVVILDSKGRAKVKNPRGELYKASEVRVLKTQQGNAAPGAYVPYTAAQMKALMLVLLWLKRRHPSTFRLERVFGHDEVAPRRKVDPGGSLGALGDPHMTMNQLRAQLLKIWADQIAQL